MTEAERERAEIVRVARAIENAGQCGTCGTPCEGHTICDCERPIWEPASPINQARAALSAISPARQREEGVRAGLEAAAGWLTEYARRCTAMTPPHNREARAVAAARDGMVRDLDPKAIAANEGRTE